METTEMVRYVLEPASFTAPCPVCDGQLRQDRPHVWRCEECRRCFGVQVGASDA